MKRPSLQPFGENAVLIAWEAIIDEAIHREVVNYDRFISETFEGEVLETVMSYHSIAVYLKEGIRPESFIEAIREVPKLLNDKKPSNTSHLITIPVCYEEEFAPDIEHVARYNSLSKEDVIRLHSETIYKVYFMGFLPGFPYLGGLHPTLSTPRRKTPRSVLEKGAVGIGGNQTGVYPTNSPGGWNIIGRSPISFFDLSKNPPSTLLSGDAVKFEPITKAAFEHTKTLVENGIYLLNKTPYHD